ncbi:PLD nuclease N-terminal domain-containing protein [uncultured Sulfitobacter sp.]|uniref:PLD nuclease N-terminal domain-containing protein n=1 Tax=uncultured Sulfitobacter sp. TaxID=191468 RepID=UPI00260896DD|nr:PLD nuclease N-terminal domain-containing protein [uncultured Sulfitobacter sp.]
MEYAGIGGVIVLALNIWAIISIFSSGATVGSKVIWTLLVLILPVIGFVIWFFAGPRAAGSHA